MSGLHIL